ncbi:thioredoxin-disulfide reductase [Coelomomyces lativittatus]|nr:thioredoxin-disulfide reductase [Coelomomyces lativittatus]KAJ1513300.1 thioredoxin-disulfide reductase [Coelomomyces lativittatus]
MCFFVSSFSFSTLLFFSSSLKLTRPFTSFVSPFLTTTPPIIQHPLRRRRRLLSSSTPFALFTGSTAHMAPVPPLPTSSSASTQPSPIIHPVIIIGSGPSAHTAAIYAGRAKLNPLLFEGFMAGGVAAGGQLTTTTEIENFPGFPQAISGSELMERMREQSIQCGTQILTETVSQVDLSTRPFKVWTEDHEQEPPYLAHALILATGATARRLHLPGESEYWNQGMSACAVCDGPAPIFRNQPVCVMGGGDTACEEAVFLTKYASKVYLLHRRDTLRASKIMADRVLNHPQIQVLWNTVPCRVEGHDPARRQMTHVILKSVAPSTSTTTSSPEQRLECRGFFYAIGHVPNVTFLKGQVHVDPDQYIVVQPGTSMTSVPGVFACGDVVDKKYRQAITAAGMGCQAALECERWLESLHG